MPSNDAEKTGVVLMTYGSATTADGVPDYLKRIYRGADVPAGVVEEFKRRYRLIGRSPLIDITTQQARHLEEVLNQTEPDRFVVRAGMRHSDPSIEQALRDCQAAGATAFVGIVLSPQFSSVIMDGYLAAFRTGAERIGVAPERLRIVGPWPTEPSFIRLIADRVRHALQASDEGKTPRVIFTTHSLPKRVIEADPGYLEQLQATTDAILHELNDPNLPWTSAYQSAGHSPEPWLTPDLLDVLADMKGGERRRVLLVPIQFLSDHLEVLYDLDIAARRQCDAAGIGYGRIELANTDARFIRSLAALVQAQLL